MSRSDAEILWEVASVLARAAAKVSGREGRPGRGPPPLLFFTDRLRTRRPWETAARLPLGSGVVYRHFGAPDARDTALRLREATRRRNGLLLIGLDAELAEEVGADGVHLPERALEEAGGVRAARPDWWITGAVHSGAALAGTTRLDAAVSSPVFPAGGSSSATPALGLPAFRSLVAMAHCPVYALGGIDPRCAWDLVGSGACGLAGVSALQKAFGAAGRSG